MKGVILCAGQGTRMRPFSFTLPKTLLPLGNRPILDYCIQNMLDAGIFEIGVVINPFQKSIAEYLNKYNSSCSITVIYQTEQLGISHALKRAQPFLGNDPFIVLLGDNLINEPLESLIEAFKEKDSQGAILLSSVDNPQEFGIAEIKGGAIKSLAEKPAQPKSNLAIIGAYLFDRSIFDAINRIAPSQRGELEITDAMQKLIADGGKVSFCITQKPYFDVGTLDRWLNANEWVLRQRLGSGCLSTSTTLIENCKIQGPVMIGEECVMKNAVIGPNVSVLDGCTLMNCTISDSICMEGTEIRSSATITRSIFGRKTRLSGHPSAPISCFLGDNSELRF